MVDSLTNLCGEEVMKEGINPRVGRTQATITGLRTLRRANFDNICVMSSKSETR